MKASQRLFKSRKLLDLKERERFSAASDFSGVYGCGSGLVFALHVPCETALLSCPVITHGACEWFLSVVPHVPCESALSSCSVLTHGACEWFLSCVGAHVRCESALKSCPVLTHGACEWFLSCVAHVLCEIAFELSCTHTRCMRMVVSCVVAHVPCEMALSSCLCLQVHANGFSPCGCACTVRSFF